MKKIIILLTIILSFPLTQIAQTNNPELNVDWTDIDFASPKSKNMILMKAFKIEDEYVLIRKEPIKGPGRWLYFVERYDDELNRVESINISEMIDEENSSIETIKKVQNSLLIVTSEKNKKEKKITTSAQMISFPSLEKTEKIQLYSGSYKKKSKVTVVIKTSPDEEVIMVVLYPPYGTGEKVKYNIYSSHLELLFKRDKVNLGEDNDHFSIDKTIITNQAEVLIMGTTSVETGKREYDHFYKIYRITEDNEDSFEFEEEIEGVSVSDPTIFQDKEGNLFGGGYYNKEGSSIIKGAFLFQFNVEEMEVTDFVTQTFTDEFVKEGFSEKLQKKMDKKKAMSKEIGMRDLVLTDIVLLENGDFYMIGAVMYSVTSTITDANGSSSNHTSYYHNDIVVSMVTGDGEFLWTKKIIRRSLVVGTQFGFSHHYLVDGDELYVVFNGQKSDVEPVLDELDDHKKKSRPTLILESVHFDSEGNMEPTAVIDYLEEPYSGYRPYYLKRDMETVGDHQEIIALTYYGSKKFGLAKISVKK